MRHHRVLPAALRAIALAIAVCLASPSLAQQTGNGGTGNGTGTGTGGQTTSQGVYIDTSGVLRNRKTVRVDSLRKDRSAAGSLCYISLPKLFDEMRQNVEAGREIPERMWCLDGLVQVTHVFVDPDERDLIIAGPAEPWDASDPYRPRGVRTGRPVIQLNDLIVALRHIGPGSSNRVFGCTLLPEEGAAQRIAAYQKSVRPIHPNERMQAVTAMKRAIGSFDASYYGVPTDTRYAMVSVEADYMMKRLCLGVDPIPVKGLKSHLLNRIGGSLVNRFWFVADYEPLLVSEDELAYEIRGQGLKVLASDSPHGVGTSNPAAQAFADDFTRVIPELEEEDPVYADLHNLSNLAIATSLIAEDRLDQRAGWDMSWVLDEKACPVGKVQAPSKAESIVNFNRKGRMTIILGGGVSMRVGEIVGKRSSEGTPTLTLQTVEDDEWSRHVEAPDEPRSRRSRRRR